MRKTIRNISYLIVIVLAVSLAYSLRSYAADRLSIDDDEDDYLRAGQEFAHLIRTSNWRGFLDTNYRSEHPQLAKIMFGLSILNLPEGALVEDVPITADPARSLPPDLLHAARRMSATWGTITAGLLALMNPLGGLLLAIHSFTIKYTSQVMLDGFAALMSTATAVTYHFARKKTGKSRNALLFISAILLGLSASSKYLHFAVGLAILFDWFLIARETNQIKRYLWTAFGWGILSIVIFFIFNPFFWPDPIGRIQTTLEAVSGTATNPNVVNAGYPFWQQLAHLSTSVPVFWNPSGFHFRLDGIIFILAMVGLTRTWRNNRFITIWLIVDLFLLVVWRTRWAQYILVATAPLSFAAAEGIKVLVAGISEWWRSRADRSRLSVKPPKREAIHALPWLIPGIAAFALLTLLPLLFEVGISMTDFNTVSLRDGFNGGIWRALQQGLTGQVPAADFDLGTRSNVVNFTGLNSYTPVIRFLTSNFISGVPWNILFFNILWTLLSVLLQCTLGLGAALLLWQRGVRIGKFWQAVFILPWAIPELIGAQMWLNIFIREWGWLYLAADQFGPDSFFTVLANNLDNGASLWLLPFLLAGMWYGFPFMMLAASAGLKTIPQEVLDAAAIDGAGPWQTFRNVTWPLLLPLIVPALIVRGIFSFNQFYLFQTFYYQDATLATLSYNVFNPNAGFSGVPGGQFAISAVINIVAVIALIFFVVVFNRWSKAGEGVTYA